MESTHRNLADTLADILPTAHVVHTQSTETEEEALLHVAVPRNFDLKTLDQEHLLPHPRRTKAVATLTDTSSFVDYVRRHAQDGTVTWCQFDPQSYALFFTAVIDEHARDAAGWRGHRAEFRPAMSAEWKAWLGMNAKAMSQVAFAEWIQDHEDDINSTTNGLPTSLQMHAMATEFVANEERALKSTVRLQSGGVRLTYIADPDAGTTETMQMFERFAIGIPVFHGGSAWALTARLKYRLSQGKVTFFYEFQRPDRVHEGAARELIHQVREGIGEVPMLMGGCN